MRRLQSWQLWLYWLRTYGEDGMADQQGGLNAFLQHQLEDAIRSWQRAGVDHNAIEAAFAAAHTSLIREEEPKQAALQAQRQQQAQRAQR